MSDTRAGTEPRASEQARRFLDEREFSRLYARSARPLAAYLGRLTGDRDVARDLVQEAFLRLLRTELPEMRDHQLNAYLYTTASRLARDRWRHGQVERRWRETLPPADARTPSDRGRALDIDRVLRRLRPRDRAVVWLAYVEGRSHAEIAGILGLRTSSVRVLLFRARKKLAGLLIAAGLAPKETS